MTDPTDPIYPGSTPTYEPPKEYRSSRAITITAILSCTFILLACILSATIVLAYFFANAPWG
jgi:hypothetical protein